ncbi:acyl carrier protein [Actinacidiphila glaucinigra]
MEDLREEIKSILVNDLFVEIPLERIGVDDSLRNVLGLDSLGFLELRVICEQKYGIEVSEAEFTPENFTSIQSIVDMVLRLRDRQPETA